MSAATCIYALAGLALGIALVGPAKWAYEDFAEWAEGLYRGAE